MVAATIGTFIGGNLVLGFIRKGVNRAFHFGCFLFAFGTFFSPPYPSLVTFQSTLSPIYLDFPKQIYL